MWVRKMKGERKVVNKAKKAELHRILDDLIEMLNDGYVINFDLSKVGLEVLAKKENGPTVFCRTNFNQEENYRELQQTAEMLETEMGVE